MGSLLDSYDKISGQLDSQQPAQQTTSSLLSSYDAALNSINKSESGSQEIAPWYQRMVQGMVDPLNRGVQLLSNAVTGPLAAGAKAIGANQLAQDLAGQTESLNAEQRAKELAYQQASPGLQGKTDWWRMAGNVASPINLAIPTEEPLTMGGLALSSLKGAATAPLFAPAPDPKDYWKQTGAQMAEGAVLGPLSNVIGKGVGAVISPTVKPEVQTLLNAGVNVTPGQLMGGAYRSTENLATSIPVLGSAIKESQENAITQFNKGAYNKALNAAKAVDPEIQNIPEDIKPGHESIDFMHNQFNQAYNRIKNDLFFSPTPNFVEQTQSVLNNLNLPEDKLNFLQKTFNNQLSKGDPISGFMDGKTAYGVKETLGKLASEYQKSPSPDDRAIGQAFHDLNDAFVQHFDSSNPETLQKLGGLNLGYANYKRISQAAASPGSVDGIFTPAQLLQAVRSQDPSMSKGAFARGNALMQDYASAGKQVLATAPNSFTADRGLLAATTGAALSGLSQDQLMKAGLLGSLGYAAYSEPGKVFLRNLLVSRPKFAQPVGNAIKTIVPKLGAPSVYPLTNDQGK